MPINETTSGDNSVAIRGTATGKETVGVIGKGDAHGVQGHGGGVGVWGVGNTWHGVVGLSKSTTGGIGVYGHHAAGGTGVAGESKSWVGVYGRTESTTGGAGVWGEHPGAGTGVYAGSKDGFALVARSTTNEAVHAETNSPGTAAIAAYNNNLAATGAAVYAEHKAAGPGVFGKSKSGPGVLAISETYEGIHAETSSPATAAIAAYNNNPQSNGAAIFAKKVGSAGHAGFFDGNVYVTGDLNCHNADCAEEFDIADSTAADPGAVLVLDSQGKLSQCCSPYDKCVVGVVSGAGGFKPGIVLDRQLNHDRRKPVALMGKVYCKVDADYAPIEVGDLLTTSGTLGHAMKTLDVQRAFGAVIGKALASLNQGQGLIPILVALQ